MENLSFKNIQLTGKCEYQSVFQKINGLQVSRGALRAFDQDVTKRFFFLIK